MKSIFVIIKDGTFWSPPKRYSNKGTKVAWVSKNAAANAFRTATGKPLVDDPDHVLREIKAP